jgi:FtsH-binding integral membrane protein
MVFLIIFFELAKGNTNTATDVVLTFFIIVIEGSILGILTSLWLKRIVRDYVLTPNLTFVSCYLYFCIAEFTWVKVSDILGMVVQCLYISAAEKTKIYPESEHNLHVI